MSTSSFFINSKIESFCHIVIYYQKILLELVDSIIEKK